MRFLSILILSVFTSLANEEGGRENFSKPSQNTNDPVYIEYLKVLAVDDAAEKEVNKWIKDNDAFEAAGAGISKGAMALKVQQRFQIVRDAYEDFISRHPKHPEIRLAYGSFLMDIHEEEAALVQMEKARDLDPANPASWNNLANHYGHRGPVKKAFEYYAKAIELDPQEPVYKQNLATTVYLFRKDAKEFYNIEEQQVFDRALNLYREALKLSPTNLVAAVDYAQTYYGIKPFRTNDALNAWTNAMTLAKTTDEKQGIYLHLARVEMNTGLFEEARAHLEMVDHPEMAELKNRLVRNWIEKRNKALGVTNSAQLAPPKLSEEPAKPAAVK